MCNAALDQLARLPVLRTCTKAERRSIDRAADCVHVRAGALVSSRIEGLNPVVIVVSGELDVIASGGITTISKGSVVGAAEVLARQPRSDQVVVAATDADLVLIEPRRFVPLVETCPNFAVELLRTLARQSLAVPDVVRHAGRRP